MMPETARTLLLGFLLLLEFLEFLASPIGLLASFCLGFYSYIELAFHFSLAATIFAFGLCAIVNFWLLMEWQE
jgi:preprotein translocase subunit SecD